MNSEDEQHLKLLSIFHYILGGASAVFSSLFLVHVFWGLALLSGHSIFNDAEKNQPPAEFGYLMVGMGGFAVSMGWTLGICLVVAGRSLALRKRYTFCFVVAVVSCIMCNPFGTVLGIFSIIVLLRPSVKALFNGQPSNQ